MAPVVMIPRAIAADLARAVIGPDHPAVARVIIGRPVTIVARMKMAPVREAVSPVVIPAIAISTAAVDMSGAEAAAAEHGAPTAKTAAVKRGATAPESAASAAAKSAATMAALNFRRHSIGDMFPGRRSARIDQRQRLGALACRGRQHQ